MPGRQKDQKYKRKKRQNLGQKFKTNFPAEELCPQSKNFFLNTYNKIF
jgi:hypothetical protein